MSRTEIKSKHLVTLTPQSHFDHLQEVMLTVSCGLLILIFLYFLGSGIGAGMIKTLRRSVKSFGRSKKVMSGGSFNGSDAPLSSEASQLTCKELSHGDHSIGYVEYSVELEKCYFSDSSLFHSSLIQEFSSALMPSPSPEIEVQRSDMFLLEDHHGSSPSKSLSVFSPSYVSTDSGSPTSSEEKLVPGWPLMHHTIGFDKVKPISEWFSPEKELASSPLRRRSSEFKEKPSLSPRLSAPSPIHRRSIEKEKPARVHGFSVKPASSPRRQFSVENLASSPVKVEKPARSPLHHRLSVEKLAPSSLQRRLSEKVKGARSPIHRLFSDKEILPVVPSRIDPSQITTVPSRHMSVVDWALQLPHRSGDISKPQETAVTEKEDYWKRLGEIARDAFGADSTQLEAGSDESSYRANKKVKFSLELPKSREWSSHQSLAQWLDTLCLDRKCKAFVYEELKAATSNFSSSKPPSRIFIFPSSLPIFS